MDELEESVTGERGGEKGRSARRGWFIRVFEGLYRRKGGDVTCEGRAERVWE